MQQTPFIWLVDDDEYTLDIISRAFQDELLDHQFKMFADCQSLLAELEHTQALPSLLIIDYYMPDMNGLELVEHLNANPVVSQLKVVLFSREITQAMLLKAEALNVYQVELKPTQFGEWRQFVKDLCAIGFFLSWSRS